MNFKKISIIALLASVIGTGKLFAMDDKEERGNSATITIQPSFTDQNDEDSNISGNLGASVSINETLERLKEQEEVIRLKLQLAEVRSKQKELLKRQEEEKNKNVNAVGNLVTETPKAEEEKTKGLNAVTETPKSVEEKNESSEIQNTQQSEKQKLSTIDKVARESGRLVGQIEATVPKIQKEGKKAEKKVKDFAKGFDKARKKEKRRKDKR